MASWEKVQEALFIFILIKKIFHLDSIPSVGNSTVGGTIDRIPTDIILC